MTSASLSDAAKDTADQADNVVRRSGEAFAGVADDASIKASRVRGAAGAMFGKIEDQLPGTAREAVDAGRWAYAQGGDRLRRPVADQPIEALLLAAAVGYFVGWATNRR